MAVAMDQGASDVTTIMDQGEILDAMNLFFADTVQVDQDDQNIEFDNEQPIKLG